VWNAAATSSARVSDTTSTDSFFAAGEVRLEQAGARVDFVFDDDRLFPGRIVSGCVDFVYEGNVPVSIRLHGQPGEQSALDQYLDLDIHLTASCDEEPSPLPRFTGRLSTLWTNHPDYARGVVLSEAVEPGDRLSVWAAVEVIDDNAAQGLQSSFALTAEARP